MSFVRKSREKYISSHLHDFPTPNSKNDYLKAWVANYEISDFLRELPEELRKCVVFLRINEHAEIDSATHEEKKRIREDEEQFGGKGPKGIPKSYGPNDSMMIVEVFYPKRKLLRPLEAKQTLEATKWKAAVLDLNGHFAIAAPYYSDGKTHVVVFNSTEGNYLHAITVGLAYDLLLT